MEVKFDKVIFFGGWEMHAVSTLADVDILEFAK